MKTNWDYTELAKSYLNRPNYSGLAVDAMLRVADIKKDNIICDVGAGVAHLSIDLASRNLFLKAVEPNYAMRNLGQERTKHLSNVEWCEGVGEATKQETNFFDMVTFGSSFNVCDPIQALKETARILKPNGWFACLYNNRNLDDPIQSEIELIIKKMLPNYKYGLRREDHSKIIDESKLFYEVVQISSTIIHTQEIEACVEAWKSHATLARQAGSKLELIIQAIKEYLVSLMCKEIRVPYRTNIWLAQVK